MVTSALSLGRELWRFGEVDLAEQARGLPPGDVRALGERAGQRVLSKAAEALWPGGPRNSAVLLAAIERLEGPPPTVPADSKAARERPSASLAGHRAERWEAVAEVAQVMDERRRCKGREVPLCSAAS